MSKEVDIQLHSDGFIWIGSEGFSGVVNLSHVVTILADDEKDEVVIRLVTKDELQIPCEDSIETLTALEEAINQSEWVREHYRQEAVDYHNKVRRRN